MRRRGFSLFLFPLLLTTACSGPEISSPPLQISEEHPHFANCASYIQAAMPGAGTEARRAGALEKCLENNRGGRQVATRL
ncbi:hypothetical protein [Niveispirillum lacus]|nr:hypothetical protein [Niveispirillum lacus]